MEISQQEALKSGNRASSLLVTVQYLASAMGFTLVGLILLEGYLRLFVFGPGPKYVIDPDLGKRFAAGTSVFWGIEGHGTTHYIADGEIATPYNGPADFRVVVLGDSHTEAFQVDDDHKFVSIAETKLRQRGHSVDLHNLGYSGAAIPDYVYMAPFVKKQYAPSAVIIQISQQDFAASESFNTGRFTYFSINGDRQLEIHHQEPPKTGNAFLNQIKQSSALINYGYYRLLEIQKQYLLSHQSSSRPTTMSINDGVESLSLEETQKQELEALAKAYPGIPVVVLVLPNTPSIEAGKLVLVDPGYAELLAMVESVDGLILVEPSASFLKLAAEDELPRGFENTSPGTGHLNPKGHHVIGDLLAEALEDFLQ